MGGGSLLKRMEGKLPGAQGVGGLRRRGKEEEGRRANFEEGEGRGGGGAAAVLIMH